MQEIKIKDLKFAKYNPRVITEEEFEGLKTSLKTFGQVENIIINKDNTIISGHQRTRAWQELGNDTITALVLDLSKKQEKKLNVVMNSQAISGKYDDQLLSEILEEIKLDDDYKDLRLDVLEPLDLSEGVEDLGTEFSLPNGDKPPFQQMTFTLADEQANILKEMIDKAKKEEGYKYCETFGNENSNGNALYYLIRKLYGES